MDEKKNVLITGGAGFIGSNLVIHMVKKYANYNIFNLDALTYAGNLNNLAEVEEAPNYHFVKVDITDNKAVFELFEKHQFDTVIHLAAESHVDRSIENPTEFVNTNVLGTVVLLNASLHLKKQYGKAIRFYHVSTDEVYGTLGEEGSFTEDTKYDPHSPYSASKAASDFFVRAFNDTYGMDVVISNCSNNYGPFQFPEKLIPLVINNIKNSVSIPVYGAGQNVRDWLWVGDHVNAIDTILHKGQSGNTFNIGGRSETKNIDLVKTLCQIMDVKLGRAEGTSEKLITFVTDRPGHDFRYSIDCSKLENELGWRAEMTLEKGLEKTVDWYLANDDWLSTIVSGQYRKYYDNMYSNR